MEEALCSHIPCLDKNLYYIDSSRLGYWGCRCSNLILLSRRFDRLCCNLGNMKDKLHCDRLLGSIEVVLNIVNLMLDRNLKRKLNIERY